MVQIEIKVNDGVSQFSERLIGITPSLAAVKKYCHKMGYELICASFKAKINPTP
jgi:hypothetical protein